LRPASILDLVHAVTELAPSHPEVEVWWYARSGEPGMPAMLLVLQPRVGARPDASGIRGELARRLGPEALTVRLHQGAAETQSLYRVLTLKSQATAPLPGGS
jgi:hypothetical protein